MRSSRTVIALFGIFAAGSAMALIPTGGPRPDVTLTVVCAAALAVSIVLVATRLRIDRRAQATVWFVLLFLNLASVAIEGSLFAPAASPPSALAANLVRLAAGSAIIAGLIALLLGVQTPAAERIVPGRRWYDWLWRPVAAAAAYVLVYLVLGGINYELVTRPYYETHAGGLTVPPAATVFLFEPLRGLLVALSVLPLILALKLRTGQVAIVAGAMLFIVGGLVPLLPQTSLPLYLRLASLWEIFGQNFLTGVACAYLFLGLARTAHRSPVPSAP